MSAQRRTANRRRTGSGQRPSAPAAAATATADTLEPAAASSGEAESVVRRASVAKPLTAQERSQARTESKEAARKAATESPSGRGRIAGRVVSTERTAGVRKYVREVSAEIKKVNWPDRETTRNLTLVVIAVSVALGLVLGGLDYVLFQIFEALP